MHEARKQRLAEFVAWSGQHITGDEKGQAQIFLDRLFVDIMKIVGPTIVEPWRAPG